jgi:hypothetical protein
MALDKRIDVLINHQSWPDENIPQEILQIQGFKDINLLHVLLSTAIWTRSPISSGLELSDYWAWLRYGNAFISSPYLKLRSEWSTIDSHQKMILSDELGVGFTTTLLTKELSFLSYIDTRYFLQTNQEFFNTIERPKRRGPMKTPDYIAFDSNWKFSVLECKGTQTSPKVLIKALDKGISQKNSIIQEETFFKYKLVAGIYIPQYESGNHAQIRICDPDYSAIELLLYKLPDNVLKRIAVKLTLAKFFSLMGFYSMSDAVFNIDPNNGKSIDKSNEINIQNMVNIFFKNDLISRKISATYPVIEPDNIKHYRNITFEIKCPVELFDKLYRADDILEVLDSISDGLIGSQWKYIDRESKTELFTPFDFQLGLSIE